MKIAISVKEKKLESEIDQQFGRCKYFLIINSEDLNEYKFVENQGAIQGHGAGIKAAQQLIELEIKTIITGSLGPNATKILEQTNIKSYNASGSIKEAINNLLNNKLNLITEVNKTHAEIETNNNSNEEKIFFPLLNNNNLDSEISEHFGHAPFFGIYNVETKDFKIIENNLNHTDPTKSPIDQIEKAVNPTTIFARGIGGRAIDIIKEKGLSLKTGDYKTVKEVIKNLDKLENQTDSCGHEH